MSPPDINQLKVHSCLRYPFSRSLSSKMSSMGRDLVSERVRMITRFATESTVGLEIWETLYYVWLAGTINLYPYINMLSRVPRLLSIFLFLNGSIANWCWSIDYDTQYTSPQAFIGRFFSIFSSILLLHRPTSLEVLCMIILTVAILSWVLHVLGIRVARVVDGATPCPGASQSSTSTRMEDIWCLVDPAFDAPFGLGDGRGYENALRLMRRRFSEQLWTGEDRTFYCSIEQFVSKFLLRYCIGNRYKSCRQLVILCWAMIFWKIVIWCIY